jgi:hypothetical protein
MTAQNLQFFKHQSFHPVTHCLNHICRITVQNSHPFNSDTAYEILSEVAQYPAFKDHEMGGLKDRLLLDIAYLNQNPAVKLMEGLHETAYRTSLGYSLYMPESSIGLHSTAMLRAFTEVSGWGCVGDYWDGVRVGIVGGLEDVTLWKMWP